MLKVGVKFPKALAVLMVFLLALSPVTVLANSEESPSINYVALGDSLAEGMLYDGKTIDKGYPDYIAEELEELGYDVNLSNFGKSGYKTGDVLNQFSNEPNAIPSLQGADIVTVGVGANDLLEALGPMERIIGLDPDDEEQLDEIRQNVEDAIKQVGTNMVAILSAINNVNEHADIYVLGYYNAMPYLPEGHQKVLIPMLENLNSAILQVANIQGTTFVPTFDAFEGKKEQYLPNPANIHPNEDGYRAIADQFMHKIKENWPPLPDDPDNENGEDPDNGNGEDPGKPPAEELEGYELYADSNWIILSQNETEQLTVTLVDPDSIAQDVTKQAEYTSLNPDVVKVDRNGLVTAKGPGVTSIEITYKSLETKVDVHVIRTIKAGEEVTVNPGELIYIDDTETTLFMPDNLPIGTTLIVTNLTNSTEVEDGFEIAGDVLDFEFTFPGGHEDYEGEFLLMMGYDSDNYAPGQVDIYYFNEQAGVWEPQDGSVDEELGGVVLEASHFSTYGVLAEVEEPEDSDENGESGTGGKGNGSSGTPPKGDRLPDTATPYYNWLAIGTLLLAAGVTSLFVKRKKRLANRAV